MTSRRDEPRVPAPARAAALLERIRSRRIDLHRAMISLEGVASRAAVGRQDAWVRELGRELEDVASALRHHIDATEGPGGFFAEVLAESPRFAEAVTALRHQHAAIARRLSLLLEAAQDAHAPAKVLRLRRDVAVLLGMLVRHRQAGADLVFEAWQVDPSTGQ